jgi:hypothetical protein
VSTATTDYGWDWDALYAAWCELRDPRRAHGFGEVIALPIPFDIEIETAGFPRP